MKVHLIHSAFTDEDSKRHLHVALAGCGKSGSQTDDCIIGSRSMGASMNISRQNARIQYTDLAQLRQLLGRINRFGLDECAHVSFFEFPAKEANSYFNENRFGFRCLYEKGMAFIGALVSERPNGWTVTQLTTKFQEFAKEVRLEEGRIVAQNAQEAWETLCQWEPPDSSGGSTGGGRQRKGLREPSLYISVKNVKSSGDVVLNAGHYWAKKDWQNQTKAICKKCGAWIKSQFKGHKGEMERYAGTTPEAPCVVSSNNGKVDKVCRASGSDYIVYDPEVGAYAEKSQNKSQDW